MDKTSYRVLTLTVGCLLLLSTAAQQVIAWPCLGGCPACYTCTPTGCEPYGDCWGGCPSCELCVSCWCECLAECGCGGKTCPGCCVCSGCECVPDDSKCGECGYCYGCSCWTDDSKCPGCCYCSYGDFMCYDTDTKCGETQICQDCNCIEAGFCQVSHPCGDFGEACSSIEEEFWCAGTIYCVGTDNVEYTCSSDVNCDLTDWGHCQTCYECYWDPIYEECYQGTPDYVYVWTTCVDKNGIHY